MAPPPAAPSTQHASWNQIVKAVVEKVETYGVVVQLVGMRAAQPARPFRTPRRTRAQARSPQGFPAGKEISAKVTDATEGRTRLSINAALDDAERADFDTSAQA